MGLSHVPDMDISAAPSEDNPFAVPKTQATGKLSDQMPTDDWLYTKLNKLNLTLVEGYPIRSSRSQWPPQGPVSLASKVAIKVVRAIFQPESLLCCCVVMKH